MNAKLKGYRVMAGYTQEEIANLINISTAMYNYCENGKRSFTNEKEALIFDALKQKIPTLTLEELFPIPID